MSDAPPDAVLRAFWNASDIALVVSSASGIECVSAGFEALTGLSSSALRGQPLTSLYEGSAPPTLDPQELSLSASRYEVRLRAARGIITAEQVLRRIQLNDRVALLSSFLPSDRQRLVDALSSSEQRYRDLFEEDVDGRFVATPEWVVLDCNRRLLETLGYQTRAELIGRSLYSLTPDGPILQKLLAVTRVEHRAGPLELHMERADGTMIDVTCAIAGSPDEHGTLISFRGQVAEIGERKRLEMRLQGAERMEVIGRLAGGLAHDFNNLLTVISGNTEKLLDRIPIHDPLRHAASSIHEAAAKAASMTQQLLAYGRRQVFELQPLSLQKLVADAQPMIAELVGDHIDIGLRLAEDTPKISADARQIEHVIANLALNAREAMPSGGTLRITVDTLEIGANAPKERSWLRQGRYVRLTVTDTGHGMDLVTKAYAFQPFFTTKRMGNGRGLGLATVYGIVKQSHGFVWVESETGRGASFTLLFPVLAADDSGPVAAGQATPDVAILVVEEDAAARTFVCEALRRRGYQVFDAGSAEEAIELFASHPSRIHLVVSDSRAVTAQGAPLAVRLQAIDPRVQSLVMLEPDNEDGSAPRVLPTMPVIEKPFTLQALAAKVRDVLRSGEGRG